MIGDCLARRHVALNAFVMSVDIMLQTMLNDNCTKTDCLLRKDVSMWQLCWSWWTIFWQYGFATNFHSITSKRERRLISLGPEVLSRVSCICSFERHAVVLDQRAQYIFWWWLCSVAGFVEIEERRFCSPLGYRTHGSDCDEFDKWLSCAWVVMREDELTAFTEQAVPTWSS